MMYGDLSIHEIEHVLTSERVGRIGCHSEGQTYVVPTSYAYDGACVYVYSREGMKLRMMRANPAVCFQVDRIEGLNSWHSVIAWGTFEELHGEDVATAKRAIEQRFLPLLGGNSLERAHGMDGWGMQPATWQDAILYRIVLTKKTGRYERP
jgi:nitroimidazol reductase NimA-like FMN-containing flavoprotein (pyridoxamine 5'-phosphate oxidase superfamily)